MLVNLKTLPGQCKGQPVFQILRSTVIYVKCCWWDKETCTHQTRCTTWTIKLVS